MVRIGFWLQLLLSVVVVISVGLMSYFGAPSPVLMGLKSSVGLSFAVLALVLFLRFLSLRAGIVILSFSLSFFLILTAANWWHYQFFQVYFNFEFLPFLRDGEGAVKSIGEYTYWTATLWVAALFIVVCVIFYFWRRSSVSRNFVVGQSMISLLIGVGLMSLASSQADLLRKVNAFTLSPYYFHPVHAFFISLDGEVDNDSEKWAAFKDRNRIAKKNAFLPSEIVPQKYNVIVLVMESFRASFVGAYNPQSKLTANFDRIVKEGVLARNFYANSNYTIKGENALICGIYDHNAKISIAEYPVFKDMYCLPEILNSEGYETHYMHANYGKFYNRKEFVSQLGFSNSYFHADHFPHKEDGREYLGWGLADADFFSLALDRLASRSGRPFYAHLMSISNHYPFKYDWPIAVPYDQDSSAENKEQQTFIGYKNAIYYSDYSIGVFWDKFKKSDLFKNTIVVITADHGVWSFDGESGGLSELKKNEQFFRMPLFIYHPDMKPGEIEQVASQVDVPVTLLDMLGIKFEREHFIGKNVFDLVEKPWVVMMKGGEVLSRAEDNICISHKPLCAGVYQSCWSRTGVSNIEDYYGKPQCFSVGNDILNGGKETLLDDTHSTDVYDNAFGLISFENRRVFNAPGVSDLLNPHHPSLREFNNELKRKRDAAVEVMSTDAARN